MITKIKIAARAFFRVKNWLTYFRNYYGLVSSGRVLYELRNGVRFTLRPHTQDQTMFNQIWLKGVYSFPGFEIHDEDVVFDIGAQIGFFTVLAARDARRGKVYAFEPAPDNFKLLKKNLTLNAPSNVQVFNEAIAHTSGERDFVFYENSVSAHSFAYTPPINTHFKTIRVHTVSLEQVMKVHAIQKIDFLKMDCEGAEYEILFQCRPEVISRIQKIVMEYHDIDEDKNSKRLQVFLEQSGFRVRVGTEGDSMLYARRDTSVKEGS